MEQAAPGLKSPTSAQCSPLLKRRKLSQCRYRQQETLLTSFVHNSSSITKKLLRFQDMHPSNLLKT